MPGIDNYSGELGRVNRPKWLPVTGLAQNELLDVVRPELRPVHIQHTPPKGAAQNRRDFEAAINHRPGNPGSSLSPECRIMTS